MLAVAKIQGRHTGDDWEGDTFAKSFKTDEYEVPVFVQRAAECSAELIGDVLPAERADHVVLRVIRVELRIADVFEQRSVPGVRSGFDDSVHAASAGARNSRVVRIRLNLEFLDLADV